jgi:hypothetical protein
MDESALERPVEIFHRRKVFVTRGGSNAIEQK